MRSAAYRGLSRLRQIPRLQQLLDWAQGFGVLRRAGVEGTGSYGSGLTRFLEERGITVSRSTVRTGPVDAACGKSDPTDAESAARAVLGRRCKAHPQGQAAWRKLFVRVRGQPQCRQGQDPGREPTSGAACLQRPSFIRDVVLK